MPDAGALFSVNGFRALGFAARTLPPSMAYGGARVGGRWSRRFLGAKRDMVARHLRRADPTLSGVRLERAVDAAVDSYARYWVDSLRVPSLSAQEIDDGFAVTGFDHITRGLEAGKGVILALPHLGGWEWAGRWMTDLGHPLTVVVEPLQPPELFEWFASYRESLGMEVVPLGEGTATTVLKALRDNHVLCLLCDRDLEGDGVAVEFFGERTTLPAGPALLSLRSGAPLLPTGVYFGRPGTDEHVAEVRPPLTVAPTGKLRSDVAALTQALAGELEALIRRAPEQWHLFSPNWPSDPGYSR